MFKSVCKGNHPNSYLTHDTAYETYFDQFVRLSLLCYTGIIQFVTSSVIKRQLLPGIHWPYIVYNHDFILLILGIPDGRERKFETSVGC